jgi:hypothetical protein
MKRSPRSRKTAILFESLHGLLRTCAIAAVVAILSVLALTERSEAKIVYTPTHIRINSNGSYNLDLNHDGITDFIIQDVFSQSKGECPRGENRFDYLAETPAQGNGVVLAAHYAAALLRGVEIGPNQNFVSGEEDMADVVWRFVERGGQCFLLREMNGSWVNVSSRYLGVEFQIKGKTHFGWARLSVQVGYVYINATLTGYAYETIAGKSIKAGQTKGADEQDFNRNASLTNPMPENTQLATLGALALRAPGLSIWRRDETVGRSTLQQLISVKPSLA